MAFATVTRDSQFCVNTEVPPLARKLQLPPPTNDGNTTEWRPTA